MIQDKTSTEQLKESMTNQEIRSVQIQNEKKNPSKLSKGLDGSVKVGKGLYRAIEKM